MRDILLAILGLFLMSLPVWLVHVPLFILWLKREKTKRLSLSINFFFMAILCLISGVWFMESSEGLDGIGFVGWIAVSALAILISLVMIIINIYQKIKYEDKIDDSEN